MSAQISDTLLGLVSCYSPSGREEPAVQYLVQRMQEIGYNSAFQDSAGNAVGIIGTGPRQIVLLGHIDTVPGEIPVKVEAGKLYARGSVDAKGPLAVFTDAAAMVGEQSGWQIIVIGAVGEEKDSRGARFLLNQYHPELTIIGEPSAWDRITLGYKGCIHANITVRCNTSHPASGAQTACEDAAKIWQQVLNWTADHNRDHDKRFEQLKNSLLEWSSGEDGFTTWATLLIEGRLPAFLQSIDWLTKLYSIAGKENVEVCGHPIEAYYGEKNTPLVRSFLKAIRGAGGKPGFVVKTGTADMNIVAPVWQCPAVAYGPGDSTLDHTPNEHLSLNEYDDAVHVLKNVLFNLTGSLF